MNGTMARLIPLAAAALMGGLVAAKPATAQTRPLYSQMVRSIVTGRPMTGMTVIDRTNVTAAQSAPPQRVASDSFGHARLGGGTGGVELGFGHRAEGNAVAIDVSFNVQNQLGGSGSSVYYGNNRGGISWGGAYSQDANSWTSWEGSGLQGELTAGDEVGRASTLRVFIQADATLPFYQMTSQSTGGSRYASSLVISVGLGWQRPHR